MPKLQEIIQKKKIKGIIATTVRYSITVPNEVVEDKGWKKGQVLIPGYTRDGDLVYAPSNKKK